MKVKEEPLPPRSELRLLQQLQHLFELRGQAGQREAKGVVIVGGSSRWGQDGYLRCSSSSWAGRNSYEQRQRRLQHRWQRMEGRQRLADRPSLKVRQRLAKGHDPGPVLVANPAAAPPASTAPPAVPVKAAPTRPPSVPWLE